MPTACAAMQSGAAPPFMGIMQQHLMPPRPSYYPASLAHTGTSSHMPPPVQAARGTSVWRQASVDGGPSPPRKPLAAVPPVSGRRHASVEGSGPFCRGERPVATPLGLAALWGEPAPVRQESLLPPMPPPPPVEANNPAGTPSFTTKEATNTPSVGGASAVPAGAASPASASPRQPPHSVPSPRCSVASAARVLGSGNSAASFVPASSGRKESLTSIPTRAESFAPPARRPSASILSNSARNGRAGEGARRSADGCCSARGSRSLTRGSAPVPASLSTSQRVPSSSSSAAALRKRSSSNHRSGSARAMPSSSSPKAHVRDIANSDPEDLLDQHVVYFLRQNPKEARRHRLERLEAGVYQIDGYKVEIEWQHAAEPGQPGHLVVVDGPLRQPFSDYLANNDTNAEYSTHMIAKTSALHHVPREARMTFDDTNKKYTRLEAMKVAKEQASVREKAADYTKEGRQVPDELVRRYNKALRQKLSQSRARVAKDSPPLRHGRSEPPGPREPVAPVAEPSRVQQQPAPAPTNVEAEPLCTPPTVALMAHRGISLNGLPSCMHPQQAAAGPFSVGISRSWSGTNMPASGGSPTLAPPRLAMPPGVAMPAPLGQVHVSSAGPPPPHLALALTPFGYFR